MFWWKRQLTRAFSKGYMLGYQHGCRDAFAQKQAVASAQSLPSLPFISFEKVPPKNLLDEQLEDILRETEKDI